MKQLLLLIFLFFNLFSSSLFAQNCQSIVAEIVMTDPAISPPDTGYIDVCIGEVITFTGDATFPENDLFYHQAVDSSTFLWIFGDGRRTQGQMVEHTYEQPGGYKMTLVVTDQEGCSNENQIEVRVRVGSIPDVTFEPDGELIVCQDDTVAIQANYDSSSTFYFKSNMENTETSFVPDATGEIMQSSIAVTGFEEGQVLSATTQLQSVCVTIEHSWMFDLDISLQCPDGTEMRLQTDVPLTGDQVFLGEPYELDDINTPNPPEQGVGYTYCWTSNSTSDTWTNYAITFEPETLPEGNYQSVDSLGSLAGCPLNGEWQLIVEDTWAADNGYVFGWSLQFDAPLVDEPPFSSEITNYQWTEFIFSDLLSSSEHMIEGVPSSSGNISLMLEDSWGCSETSATSVSSIWEGFDACQACDELVVDAGPDVILDCVAGEVTLDCSNSTSGSYLDTRWWDEFGNALGTTCSLPVGEPGLYILELRSLATDCILYDTVAVLLDEDAAVADAGPDGYLSCSTPTVQLGGPDLTSGPDMTFSWSLEGNLISNDPFPVVDQMGTYTLEVTNTVNECTDTDTIVIQDQLVLDFDIMTTSCDVADGSASITLSPAIQNPQVEWSTGESGLDIENLAQGWYSVTVTDDTCVVQENFYVDQELSCKVQVSGYVYNDHTTQDCVADNPAAGEECVLLHLMPLDIYTYTDPTGHYEFVVDPGTYTVEIMPEAYFELLCPESPVFEIDLPENGSVSEGHDFYLKYAPNSFDLSISNAPSVASPGFVHQLTLEACNDGEATVDAVIILALDSLLTDFNSSPNYQTYDPVSNQIVWTVSNLPPGVCTEIDLAITVPVTVELGTILEFSSFVGPVAGDFNTSNNSKSWSLEVVGAYDPNDKQILTGSHQFGGAIYRQDSVLQYQLRFQNVGTAPAQTVVIRDTLDSNLDVTTIEAGASSHHYELQFEGNNVLIFLFEGINLPDSTNNEPESHGYVSFSIEMEDDLPFGTEIENSAAIFFDFNEPVITNTVRSVLTKPQFITNAAVELCAGDIYEGMTYAESTTLVDTVAYEEYDSVFVTDIEVFPVYEITIDTTLQPGQMYEGTVYESDTTLIQNFLTADNCDSTITVNISVEIVNSLAETAKAISLNLYPNPAKDMLQIQYRLPASTMVAAHIYDPLGQKVQTVFSEKMQPSVAQQMECSIARLPIGIYFFSIEHGGQRYVKKFVKVE